MKVMSRKTRLSSNEVLRMAKVFFNSELGIPVTDETDGCCIDFSNDLGFVTVSVTPEERGTEVKITTREWDYQIQQFLSKLK
jgi:hypothetical protein